MVHPVFIGLAAVLLGYASARTPISSEPRPELIDF
jgi:hypothetical protein